MKLAVILLICNQLRAAYLFGLFYFISFNGCCNSDPTNKYDFTSFSFRPHNLKGIIHHNIESIKDSLVCGLNEIIKHEKISDDIKINILYYYLDKIPNLKETTHTKFNEIKDANITNLSFIKLNEKYNGLTQHLNLLNAIIQLGEIRNVININNSDRSTTLFSNEFFIKLNELFNKVIYNITKGSSVNKIDQDSLDYTRIGFLDNVFIWFKDLLIMNDNKNLHYANINLSKIDGYIESIEKCYNDNNINMTEIDVNILIRLQNSLEFVHNALNLIYLSLGKSYNNKSSEMEKPNIIVSKMIINTLIYFDVLPFSKELYQCIVTNGNIDFWLENNMIGYINMFMFFYINCNSFNIVFPEYCDVVVKNLGCDKSIKLTIKIAGSLIEYLRSNSKNVDKKVGNHFNSYVKSISLEIAVDNAKRKLNNLQKAVNINLNVSSTNMKKNFDIKPNLDTGRSDKKILNINKKVTNINVTDLDKDPRQGIWFKPDTVTTTKNNLMAYPTLGSEKPYEKALNIVENVPNMYFVEPVKEISCRGNESNFDINNHRK